MHGLYQIIGEELYPLKQKMNRILHTKTESFSYQLGQVLITFVLVDLAWIFFRADTIYDAMHYIGRIFTKPDIWSLFDGTIYTLGLDISEIHILSVSLLIMFVIDFHQYRTGERIVDFLAKQCLWFHWGVVIAGICAILIYGAYGAAFDPQQFIYFQF